MRKDRNLPADGRGAAKSTVSGPRQGPRGDNGDRGAAELRKPQALAASFPFNKSKPGAIGEAARLSGGRDRGNLRPHGGAPAR